MKTAFTPPGIFSSHTEKPSMTEGAGTTTVSAVKQMVPQKDTPKTAAAAPKTTNEKLGSLVSRLEQTKKLANGSVTMHMTPEGLVISLREAGFFASGSADVQQASLDALAQITETLPQGPVRVEGHTDNIPIHTQQFATNWELSSARASTIARFLLDHGSIKPNELMAAGFAEFHPVADNSSVDGRSKNRRVDIILLSHPVTSQ